MLKEQKGITLVALIITIIVLLILAGITISLIIGNNGILNRAKEGGQLYQNAADDERNQLNTAYNEMENIINDYNLLPENP
ncbi:MAG: hypothetical protein HFJ53_05610 [Clostridia bacterium]|jgi:Tfp pilus assembly protein PilE|nr:hypothetical protein [Clostridia bacterium]